MSDDDDEFAPATLLPPSWPAYKLQHCGPRGAEQRALNAFLWQAVCAPPHTAALAAEPQEPVGVTLAIPAEIMLQDALQDILCLRARGKHSGGRSAGTRTAGVLGTQPIPARAEVWSGARPSAQRLRHLAQLRRENRALSIFDAAHFVANQGEVSCIHPSNLHTRVGPHLVYRVHVLFMVSAGGCRRVVRHSLHCDR